MLLKALFMDLTKRYTLYLKVYLFFFFQDLVFKLYFFWFLQTSASLKFTVLNPKGRIWTMVAGGGASVIYADTVGDLGYASELGNYAEYSGAPNEEEVLQYARVVIDVITILPFKNMVSCQDPLFFEF